MHGALYGFTQRAHPWQVLFAKYQIKSKHELTAFCQQGWTQWNQESRCPLSKEGKVSTERKIGQEL